MMWYWNDFIRMLTFGRHVSADAHSYSRLIVLPTYFWRLTLLYNVSAEANCFLRFIAIKFVIALATPTLRISFCRSWIRALFIRLWTQWTYDGSTCLRTQWILFILLHCVIEYHILCYNKIYLLVQLLLESSITFYSSRFLQVYFYFNSSSFEEAYFF